MSDQKVQSRHDSQVESDKMEVVKKYIDANKKMRKASGQGDGYAPIIPPKAEQLADDVDTQASLLTDDFKGRLESLRMLAKDGGWKVKILVSTVKDGNEVVEYVDRYPQNQAEMDTLKVFKERELRDPADPKKRIKKEIEIDNSKITAIKNDPHNIQTYHERQAKKLQDIASFTLYDDNIVMRDKVQNERPKDGQITVRSQGGT